MTGSQRKEPRAALGQLRRMTNSGLDKIVNFILINDTKVTDEFRARMTVLCPLGGIVQTDEKTPNKINSFLNGNVSVYKAIIGIQFWVNQSQQFRQTG